MVKRGVSRQCIKAWSSRSTSAHRAAHASGWRLRAKLRDSAARPVTLTAEEHAAVDMLVPWTRVLMPLDGAGRERVPRGRGDLILAKT